MNQHFRKQLITDDEILVRHHVILFAIAALVVLFVVWANFARLDEVTRGMGKIIPSAEIQSLQTLEGGIIEEFLVSEGEEIVKGQPLLRLHDIEASSVLGANEKKYYSLKARVKRLEAQTQGLETPVFDDKMKEIVPETVREELTAFEANKKNLKNQVQILEEQLSQRRQEVRELNTRIVDLKGVIQLSQEELEMIEPLVERGSAPKVELLQLKRSMQERLTELNSLESSLPRIRSAVEEGEARLNEVKSAARAKAQSELSETLAELNPLEETLAALKDRKTRTEIKSPVDGTVKDIKFNTVGGVVRPGEDVIEIVPKDDQLIVEARIRPSDIAFLHPGQRAIVKITAYDYSIYGSLTGALVDISADTMTDEQGETFYRVKIRTDSSYLKNNDKTLRVIPGMVASVDILTGKKSVMAYILKPLIKTLDSAMHER